MAVITRSRLDTFGALRRHPNFRLYWVGALCSNIGTWMQTLAQGWLVYQLTGSALLLGTVTFLQGLPSLLLALLGGALTDRLERRRLMLATQAAQMVLALVLAGLTLAGTVRVGQILVIAFLSGLVNAINTPVRQGIIADLVPRGDLQNAIAISAAQFQTSQFIGPAIAGVVVARLGAGWAFLANGLSFLAVIVSLLRLRLPPWTPPRKVPLWRSMAEGVAFVARHEVLGLLFLIAAVPSLLARPAQQALLPVFAAAACCSSGPQRPTAWRWSSSPPAAGWSSRLRSSSSAAPAAWSPTPSTRRSCSRWRRTRCAAGCWAC